MSAIIWSEYGRNRVRLMILFNVISIEAARQKICRHLKIVNSNYTRSFNRKIVTKRCCTDLVDKSKANMSFVI